EAVSRSTSGRVIAPNAGPECGRGSWQPSLRAWRPARFRRRLASRKPAPSACPGFEPKASTSTATQRRSGRWPPASSDPSRQRRVADWLLSCDRVALYCYQVVYMGVGKAKSIPAPPPFSYMATGFSPATYRRGIAFSKLGKQINPFPLVELPYHRLTNPWTLGAVLHEVSHNIQSDVGLARAVPRQIALRLLQAGLPKNVVHAWTRWNRETFADLSGLLMGGPAVVGSLMDVVGRSPQKVIGWGPEVGRPTHYI